MNASSVSLIFEIWIPHCRRDSFYRHIYDLWICLRRSHSPIHWTYIALGDMLQLTRQTHRYTVQFHHIIVISVYIYRWHIVCYIDHIPAQRHLFHEKQYVINVQAIIWLLLSMMWHKIGNPNFVLKPVPLTLSSSRSILLGLLNRIYQHRSSSHHR